MEADIPHDLSQSPAFAAADDPVGFVSLVQPLLVKSDVPGLITLLKSRYTADQIVAFLASPFPDARKVAALALGLVGGPCCIPPLARRLADPDPMTNQMAEHALWSIWLRAGTPEANHQVCRGVKAMERRELVEAEECFSRALQIDPKFAEAYNQRAIAKYLAEDFQGSIEDCLRAIQHMPCHFGAWAGMGHCHAHLGRLEEAIRSDQRALQINPRLQGIADTLEQLHHPRRARQ